MATGTLEAQAVWAFAEHEHRDLVRGINRIHDVACEIGHRPAFELPVHVLGVLQWLDSVLEPHLAWEESWLYQEVEARIGSRWATQAARFDHREIRDMAARLRADQILLSRDVSGDQHADARCHLFGLEALLRAHIEREERFLIPLLDDDPLAADSPAVSPRTQGPTDSIRPT
jgi:hemerythrin-like domain-containing protein